MSHNHPQINFQMTAKAKAVFDEMIQLTGKKQGDLIRDALAEYAAQVEEEFDYVLDWEAFYDEMPQHGGKRTKNS